MAKRSSDTHGLDTFWGKIHPRNFGRFNIPSCNTAIKRRTRHELIHYKPQIEDTRAAYEDLLGAICQQLGTQPPDVLAGAADELLGILKDDTNNNNDDPAAVIRKKKEVEKLLNPVSDAMFQQLVSVVDRITDFQHHCLHADDDHQFVAVEFTDSSSEDNEEPDDAQVNDSTHQSLMKVAAVNVHDIDDYWLHRKIWHALDCGTGCMDPLHSNKLAEEVLNVLADLELSDDMDVETRLVVLFDYDQFELVKFLLRNRREIVWCTRLARATKEGQQQRNEIEEEMKRDPRLASILDQLKKQNVSVK